MSEIVRPTGVIRTLPYFGAARGSKLKDKSQGEAMNKAYRRMMKAMKAIERSGDGHVLVAFAQKPIIEVLHCYLLVGGVIRVRANIADWEEGDRVGKVKCWDESVRFTKWWAILTAPVSFAPHRIERRGTQGFRYTGDLW